MITVEKIGGTSMSACETVLKNIIFFNRQGDDLYNRLFVVSAYAGVTNWLLEDKKTGEPGIYHRIAQYKEFDKALDDITDKLKELNNRYVYLGLNLEEANSFIEKRIDDAQKYLQNLANILASGYVSDENILQAAREILASLGESHSAFILVNILKHQDLNATLVDLSGLYDHQPFTIDQRIEDGLKGIDFAKTICIVTGYAKGVEGIMREFDRGYSEITFSKIAVLLKPEEAIIHKEYHLSSADPIIVGEKNCIPIGNTNYNIADQLAGIGMEAIHPRASKPLELNNINIRVKRIFQPEHPGTLISTDYISPHKKVEIVAGTKKVIIIHIYDKRMVRTVVSELKIMRAFESASINYIFKSTSANSMSILIWQKDLKESVISQLEKDFSKVTIEEAAIACVIGSNIDKPGVLALAAAALAALNINIKSAGFSLDKTNIQFVIPREDFERSIKALNETVFF